MEQVSVRGPWGITAEWDSAGIKEQYSHTALCRTVNCEMVNGVVGG